MSIETKKGNRITAVKEAQFVSFVNRPANRRAFSIVRGDKVSIKKVGRARRSDPGAIALVTFPAGFTEEQATASLAHLGLQGHKVQIDGEAVLATRADLQSTSNEGMTPIKLDAEGTTVWLESSKMSIPEVGSAKLAVQAIRFDTSFFESDAQISAWLTENSVDFTQNAIHNSEGVYVLKRHDLEENTETREVQLDDGVTAVVVRSDLCDVPEGFYAVINECAYGHWGWGQLDFTAMFLDRTVGEALEVAETTLTRVLREILFYSALPIDIRKELVSRALSQYGSFVTGLLDMLPRQLLVTVTQTSDKSGGSMDPKDAPKAAPAVTQEAPAASDAPAGDQAAAETPITRKDVEAMIAAAVAAKPVETAPVEAAPAAAEEATSITRADILSAMQETLKPVAERLDKLEGTAIVRSDVADPAAEPEEEKIKRNGSEGHDVNNPFAGVLGAGFARK